MLATDGKIRRSSLGGHLLSPERANTQGNGDANGRYAGLAAREANVGNMDYIERARAKISTTAKLKQSQEIFDKLCAGREKLASSRERVRHDAIKDWTFSTNITAKKTRTGGKLSPRGLGNGSNAPYAGLALQGPTRARDATKDSTFSSNITANKTRTGGKLSPRGLGDRGNAPYAGLALQRPTRARDATKDSIKDSTKDSIFSPEITSNKTRTGRSLSPWGLGIGTNAPYLGVTLQGPTRIRDTAKDWTFCPELTSNKTRTGRSLNLWGLGDGSNAAYAGVVLQRST